MHNAFLESKSSATEMAIGLKKDWVFDNVSALRNALDEVDTGNASHVTFLMFPRFTGHRVKNHIMTVIQNEVLDEETTKNPQSGVQERSGGVGG